MQQIDTSQVQNDRSDKTVQEFLEMYEHSKQDQDRRDMMDEIEENRNLKDQLFMPLNTGKRLKKFKDTLLLQTDRRYTEEGRDIPKPFAKSRNSQLQHGYVAEAIQEREYEHSYIYRQISKAFNAEKTDGLCGLQVGMTGGVTSVRRIEVANVHFDPRCTELNEPPESPDASGWMIYDVSFSYNDAVKEAQRLTGESWEKRLLPGAPMVKDADYTNLIDTYKQGQSIEDTDVVFSYAYNYEKNIEMIYGGGAASIIVPPRPIQFRPRNIRGDRVPRSNVVWFGFSDIKKGAYPLSLYGAIKDVTEPMRDFLDRVFQQLKIQINPYVFLFSDAGASVIAQMKNASRMNDLGSVPLVLAPGSEKAKMEHIGPKDDLLGYLLRFRAYMLEEVAQRLGLNIQRQQDVDQPFSTFERKNQFENMAIKNHNEINKHAFSLLADYVVDIQRMTKGKNRADKVTVSFKDKSNNVTTSEISYKAAMMMLDEWDGRFTVDPNIRIPINNAEKLEVMKQVNDIITADSAQGLVRTEEQALLKTEMLWELVRRADLEERFSREVIHDFYMSLVGGGQPQQDPLNLTPNANVAAATA